jgi:crotonobetainyl-CoA:carnitine CoA-transferase CaiB-like acyl-CoA transferase
MADSALGRLQILDFSRVLAGPLATMTLADLGAEVTKIERPGSGDDTRSWGPPYDEQGEATYFQAVNRNKTSVALDLGDAADLAQARRLALAADVVVENFRPGLMTKLGLDYATLSAASPGLVYCSITGFGGAGVGAELPGYDLLVQALGGLMSITGEPDGEPLKVGVALVDVVAGLYAAVGILAALEHRRRSGEGQLVEVDLLSALLAGLVNQSSAYTVAGVVPGRMGNRHPSIAPYELLRCRNEELVLAVGNDRQFGELCEVLGEPSLAADERFATNPARVQNREELKPRLERALAARPAAAWVELLRARRVPAGLVNDVGAAFELAERIGLDPIVEVPREDGAPVRLPRSPIRLSKTPATYRLPPPRLP